MSNQIDPQDASNRTEEKTVTYAQIDSLRKCISTTIDSYRIKKRKNKIGAITVQTLSILFSFGTTVLIGWKIQKGVAESIDATETINATLMNWALIVSALATGINTLDKFFDYKTLWIGYNVSISNLKSALAKLDYLASLGSENIQRKQLDDIFNSYELTCLNMDKNYQEIRSAKDE